jgi:hypothetical protein
MPPTETALRKQNLGYVLPCLSVDNRKGQAARPPIFEISQGHIASGFRVIEAAAGIAFDKLRHGTIIN